MYAPYHISKYGYFEMQNQTATPAGVRTTGVLLVF